MQIYAIMSAVRQYCHFSGKSQWYAVDEMTHISSNYSYPKTEGAWYDQGPKPTKNVSGR